MAKTLAFYLPQYYPIPENDGWYGTGFTEWHNVAKASPLFPGHYQPHLPADLGFYDLRVPEVRQQQARMARAYGIDGFVYYHYWFQGQRPLRRVIDEVLASADEMPFCLAWANENWSRHWDASENEVLLRQTYSESDDEEHAKFLLTALRHPNYIRVNGKPLLFMYRPQRMPNAAATFDKWRAYWAANGIPEVEIVAFNTHGSEADPAHYHADSTAQFWPHHMSGIVPEMTIDGLKLGNTVMSYEDAVEHALAAKAPAWRQYECVMPAWDNTSRRGDGLSTVFHGSTPELYEKWLSEVVSRAGSDGIVLINAWNEWAEGAHLEPDVKYGHAYLEATARAVGTALPVDDFPMTPLSALPERNRDYFADRYLDAVEAQTRLQRRLSRLEATLDHQVDHRTRDWRNSAERWKDIATGLASELEFERSKPPAN